MTRNTSRIRSIIALVVAGLLFGTSTSRSDDERTATTGQSDSPRLSKLRDPLDARCIDGSVLKVTLLDAKIPVKTDYGLFEIAASDIRRIEFATRVPQSMDDRVKAAIARLGNKEYGTREAAGNELLSLGAIAYPALVEAARSDDAEVAYRASHLMSQIRSEIPEADLQSRRDDLIVTDKSQIAGEIAVESLKVDTILFGPQQLKLAMLRKLEAEDKEEVREELPDPGSLAAYQGQIGKTFYFKLTGPPPGMRNTPVWGTDVYTLDSNLALAAVHAGVLRPGQTKVVGVNLLGPQNSFASTPRNGVTSFNFGQYPGAFTFKSEKPSNVLGGKRGP